MNLQCKDGDIAVVTWDYLGCASNIGRLVQVRGPVSKIEGAFSWSIRPVTQDLYAVMEGDHSKVTLEVVDWNSQVTHRDAWMKPLNGRDDLLCTWGDLQIDEPASKELV